MFHEGTFRKMILTSLGRYLDDAEGLRFWKGKVHKAKKVVYNFHKVKILHGGGGVKLPGFERSPRSLAIFGQYCTPKCLKIKLKTKLSNRITDIITPKCLKIKLTTKLSNRITDRITSRKIKYWKDFLQQN